MTQGKVKIQEIISSSILDEECNRQSAAKLHPKGHNITLLFVVVVVGSMEKVQRL
jgi:hypothetical protein